MKGNWHGAFLSIVRGRDVNNPAGSIITRVCNTQSTNFRILYSNRIMDHGHKPMERKVSKAELMGFFVVFKKTTDRKITITPCFANLNF